MAQIIQFSITSNCDKEQKKQIDYSRILNKIMEYWESDYCLKVFIDIFEYMFC